MAKARQNKKEITHRHRKLPTIIFYDSGCTNSDQLLLRRSLVLQQFYAANAGT
jgi:hypothetical protein